MACPSQWLLSGRSSASRSRPQADVVGGRLSGGPPAPRPIAPHALREGPTACRNSSRTNSTPFSSAAPWPTTSFGCAAPTAGKTSWSPSASIAGGSAHHAERAGCRRPRRINSRLSAVAPGRLQLKHGWGWWSTCKALHPRTLIFALGQRAPGRVVASSLGAPDRVLLFLDELQPGQH